MQENIYYYNVFVPGGYPTYTYNPREELKLQEILNSARYNLAKLMIVTGQTKAGKTVLVDKVYPHDKNIWVDGGTITTEEMFWETIVEQLNGYTENNLGYNEDTQLTMAIRNSIAGGIKLISGASESSNSETTSIQKLETRARKISNKVKAVEILKAEKTALIIDDFHYIAQSIQKNIVRALKAPIMEGVPVIFIAIPSRKFEVINIEREMTGNNLNVSNGSTTMNRADGFEASYPTTPQEEDTVMPEELKEILDDNNYSTREATLLHDEDVDMPVTGKDSGLQLIDLRGLPYDAPEWETYIEQWTTEDMALLLGKAGFQTEAFTEYGKPTTLDNDGPQAFRHQALGEENEKVDTYYMTAFPCEALLACTWNEDLLEEIGQNVGAEGSVNGMSGWYAPGLNTHRTAFGGRNFEYFSEDPFLSGKLAAREISGAADYGIFTYIKHFAMNDQEAFCRSWCCGMHMDESLDRFQNDEWILMTWATEQTVREIYLKAFEIAIKESTTELNYVDSDGNPQVVENFRCATGVMTSFNCVGNTWSGGNYALLQTVLRDEWGFCGTALTDYALHDFMYPDQMIRNGGTACLQSNRKNFVDQDDPSATTVKYLQNATHEMCYMVANSNAMNGVAPGAKITYSFAPWEVGCAIGIGVTGVLFATVIVLSVMRVRDEKRNPDKYATKKKA